MSAPANASANFLHDMSASASRSWDTLTSSMDKLTLFDLGVAVGIFLAALIVRRAVTWIILRLVAGWAESESVSMSGEFLQALRRPISLLPVIAGLYFALKYLQVKAGIGLVSSAVAHTLFLLILFWGLYSAIEPMRGQFRKLEATLSPPLVRWVIKLVKGAVIFVGAAAILSAWDVEIGPILAGLGLFGVAVALGAKDLFQNVIAGLLIMVEHRFCDGDWIKVEGVAEGTVEDIGLRSTRIRRFDQAPMFVPNSKLSDNAVTNFSHMTYRRIYWAVGVTYDTSVDQLRQIRDGLFEYITGNEAFASPQEASTFVHIDSFNDSSIDIMVYCFTRTRVWAEWLKIKEELAYKVMEIVEGAGSSIAFPTRTVHLESALPNGDEAQPEPFVPPKGQ